MIVEMGSRLRWEIEMEWPDGECRRERGGKER